MSEKYSSGVTPQPSDTERQLLVKILNALNGGSAFSGGGTVGTGSPVGTTPATSPAWYIDANNNFWVNKDGTPTGWVELIGS